MKHPTVYIGTSSYNNQYWQPRFFPEDLPRSKWFAFYCEHFKTYEINVTFYRFPTVRTLQTWYKKSPDGFLFAVKAPKVITHIKRFKAVEEELATFYSVSREGLSDKLGCVLFQLPPSFKYSAENLELIVTQLNPDFKNVVEFRNSSWWQQEVYDAFSEKRITFCNVSYAGLPTEFVSTTELGYLRLHGVPKLFYSEYSNAELLQFQLQIDTANPREGFFVYFNNTAGEAGIDDALRFASDF